MRRLFPLRERGMMIIVAAATNLGGNRHFWADRNIPDVGNVTGPWTVAILALYTGQLRGRRFILESQGRAVANRVTDQAGAVRMLVYRLQ